MDHRSKYKQINVLLLLQEQTPSLLVTVNTHHLLPACLRCLLLLIVRVLIQFPIATSRTKRESFRWQIIMKDISFPFSASTSVDHRRRRYLFCSPELHGDERCRGWAGEGPAREGRLLHMSVAMGILAQWLCSNAAAGTEDLFSQGRHWWEKKKQGKKMECAWAGASATNYVAGAFILDRVSEASLRAGARCCLADLLMFSNCLGVQMKLRPAGQPASQPAQEPLGGKSISIRGRQWRADGGFIIACCQDKCVNHLQRLHRNHWITVYRGEGSFLPIQSSAYAN